MPIRFACPKCKTIYTVNDNDAGCSFHDRARRLALRFETLALQFSRSGQ